MRLADHEAETIRQAVGALFGSDSEVWLFGSRVDDTKRGGDIDLLVVLSSSRPDEDAAAIWNSRIRLLERLERQLGERKIDVVMAKADDSRPIVAIARSTGVRL
ncbi:MAG: nucleotidyltransferase domain-containing protein [Magnetococcales bacterium]|nr:nucleotidyltransferase domain-containing protein [Magnetococcales bacterium]